MFAMRIERLMVRDFRNLEAVELAVPADARVVALVGPNGAGKTSVLEALSLLGGGRGLLGADAREQVRRGAKRWGMFAEGDGRSIGMAWQSGSREVKLDGVDAKTEDAAEVARVVWMSPRLDRLFFDAPGDRRDWLDDRVAGVWPAHEGVISRYQYHLRGRMKLLLERGIETTDWLEAEERQAAEWGIRLMEGRQKYCEALNFYGDGVVLGLKGAALEVLDADDPMRALQGKFERSRAVDARMERTHAGPNTLDVVATVDVDGVKVELDTASSGQHKRGLVKLLMAHVRLVRERSGISPIVLIDELGAHLDAQRRAEMIAALVELGCQMWVSDTETPAVAGVLRVDMLAGGLAA